MDEIFLRIQNLSRRGFVFVIQTHDEVDSISYKWTFGTKVFGDKQDLLTMNDIGLLLNRAEKLWETEFKK